MYRRLAASFTSQQKAERYVAHAERLEQLVRRENHHADWFVRLAHELGRGQPRCFDPVLTVETKPHHPIGAGAPRMVRGAATLPTVSR